MSADEGVGQAADAGHTMDDVPASRYRVPSTEFPHTPRARRQTNTLHEGASTSYSSVAPVCFVVAAFERSKVCVCVCMGCASGEVTVSVYGWDEEGGKDERREMRRRRRRRYGYGERETNEGG